MCEKVGCNAIRRWYEGIIFFFFSSRRRHTRSLCDWSSDVCSSDLPHFTNKATPRSFNSQATPIKCLDLDDNSGQLKLESWLYIDFIGYTLFHEEAPFYRQLGGGIILLVIMERRPHFTGYFGGEAPFYWVNLGGGWWSFLYLCPKLCWRLAGVPFYGPCTNWRAGDQDQVFYQCGLNWVK